MSGVNPVYKEVVVTKSISEVRENILKILQALGGKIAYADDKHIQCDFGSSWQTKVFGAFWVSESRLPKRVTLGFQNAENESIKINVEVRDNLKYVLKFGFVKKYEKSLVDLANTIISLLK
ncbi:MAG: hypothetical protein ABSG67_14640 [Thermoguttaceae bacterium]|jgi:hypothetical protein